MRQQWQLGLCNSLRLTVRMMLISLGFDLTAAVKMEDLTSSVGHLIHLRGNWRITMKQIEADPTNPFFIEPEVALSALYWGRSPRAAMYPVTICSELPLDQTPS
jgi:hypothetical protein